MRTRRRIIAWLPMLTLWAALPLAAMGADPQAGMQSTTSPFPPSETTKPPTPPDYSIHPELKANDFTGSWDWQEGDDQLRLSLIQNGDKLTGYHMSRHLGTGQVDGVSYPEPPSIVGEVHGPVVVARFRSGEAGNYAYGHVRLTLRDRYLYWQLMDTAGTSTLPQNVVLIRRSDKPQQ